MSPASGRTCENSPTNRTHSEEREQHMNDTNRTEIYEYRCSNCGTGRAKTKKQTPQTPCDMCAETDWQFQYARNGNIGARP